MLKLQWMLYRLRLIMVTMRWQHVTLFSFVLLCGAIIYGGIQYKHGSKEPATSVLTQLPPIRDQLPRGTLVGGYKVQLDRAVVLSGNGKPFKAPIDGTLSKVDGCVVFSADIQGGGTAITLCGIDSSVSAGKVKKGTVLGSGKDGTPVLIRWDRFSKDAEEKEASWKALVIQPRMLESLLRD